MLLQSHELYNEVMSYVINVIPAIPEMWSNGEFSGLCARGGFEVSAKWKDCKPIEIRVKSLQGEWAYIRTELDRVTDEAGNDVPFKRNDGVVLFGTRPGAAYIIS